MFSIISDLANEQNPKTVLLIPFFSNHPAVDIYMFVSSSRQETKNSSKKKWSDIINRLFCFQIKKDFTYCFKNQTKIKEKWSKIISKIENYIKEKKIPNFDYLLILITEQLGVSLSKWMASKKEQNKKIGNLHFLFSDSNGIDVLTQKNKSYFFKIMTIFFP